MKIFDLTISNGSLYNHKIEAADFGIEPQNSRQHENRSDHRIKKEFDRRINLPSMAVHANEQRHGDQRRFPEKIEQKKVERDEDSDEGGLQHKGADEEFFHT